MEAICVNENKGRKTSSNLPFRTIYIFIMKSVTINSLRNFHFPLLILAMHLTPPPSPLNEVVRASQ